MSLSLILAVFAAFALLMSAAFLVQRATGNSGWIDAIWSFGTGGIGAGFVAFATSHSWRMPIVAALLLLWSLRLGGHIAGRAAAGGDDPRYADLMRQWGPAAPVRLFLFLQAQALASTVLVIAALAAALNAEPPGVLDFVALLVALGALAGESLADHQLQRAKAAGEAICERGLWALSRHPNYFFEFLFWCALPLLAFAGDGAAWWPGLLALAAPVQMYVLLAHVSGVPPLEAHMLRRHGAAFAAYQARVNVFFPGPRHALPAPNPARPDPLRNTP